MTPDGLLELRDIAVGARHLVRRAPQILTLARTFLAARPDTRLSLGHVLEQTAHRHPEAVALRWEGGALTYEAFNRQCNRIAHALFGAGVAAGDVVGVLMDARPEVLMVAAAAAKLGATASMLNPSLRRGALAHALDAAPPRCVVGGAELWEILEEAEDRRERPTPLRFWMPDGAGGVPPDGARPLCEAADRCPDHNPPSTRAVRMRDPALYVFTSGTTGLPKASAMSHKRWIGAGLMFGGVCLRLGPEDALYAPLPLYHNQAITLAWSSTMRAGAALCIRRRFSAQAFWDDCRHHGATAITYIGEIASYLLGQPETPADRDHRVRRAVGVGMRPEIWHAFKARFGVDEIYEYYSASELNAGFFNVLNLERTVGFCPTPWALVAFDVARGEPLRDPRGRMVRVDRGGTGLLVTRVTRRFGFEGYTDPAATEAKLLRDVFQSGDTWVNTGDLMRNLGYGHLQFVDRVGDTFRWKSENVATREVEAAVNGAPDIRECSVYGVAVADLPGRAGMAAVVPRAAALDPDALLRRLLRELPRYAVPVFLRVTRDLCTTTTFKHQKGALREAGFDPRQIADPLFVLLPSEDRYAPLTPDLYDRIAAGQVRL